MKFIKDTRKQDIVSALLSGQSKVTVDGIEIFLKALKRDTRFNKEKEAKAQADKIIKSLDS